MTSRHSQQRTFTLLELFVQSSGSLHAHSLLQIDEELLPAWHVSMLTYITLMGKISTYRLYLALLVVSETVL
jgi:hypothetical protein